MYVPNQWKMALQCNPISQWLGTYTEWSLHMLQKKKSTSFILECSCFKLLPGLELGPASKMPLLNLSLLHIHSGKGLTYAMVYFLNEQLLIRVNLSCLIEARWFIGISYLSNHWFRSWPAACTLPKDYLNQMLTYLSPSDTIWHHQSGTKPNLVAICAWIPKLVANVSS